MWDKYDSSLNIVEHQKHPLCEREKRIKIHMKNNVTIIYEIQENLKEEIFCERGSDM